MLKHESIGLTVLSLSFFFLPDPPMLLCLNVCFKKFSKISGNDSMSKPLNNFTQDAINIKEEKDYYFFIQSKKRKNTKHKAHDKSK